MYQTPISLNQIVFRQLCVLWPQGLRWYYTGGRGQAKRLSRYIIRLLLYGDGVLHIVSLFHLILVRTETRILFVLISLFGPAAVTDSMQFLDKELITSFPASSDRKLSQPVAVYVCFKE